MKTFDIAFAPGRFDRPDRALALDYSELRELVSMVGWTEMTKDTRDDVLKAEEALPWKTVHKKERGDDENAISFDSTVWAKRDGGEAIQVGEQYREGRAPVHLLLCEFEFRETSQVLTKGVFHAPADVWDRSGAEWTAHQHILKNVAGIMKNVGGPVHLSFDGNLDYRAQWVREYYDIKFAGTKLSCTQRPRPKGLGTLHNRFIDLSFTRGLIVPSSPVVYPGSRASDHRYQADRKLRFK